MTNSKKDYLIKIAHAIIIIISCGLIYKTTNWNIKNSIDFDFRQITNVVIIFFLIITNIILQSYIFFFYLKNFNKIKINYIQTLNIHLKSSLTNIGIPFIGFFQKYFLLNKYNLSKKKYLKIHLIIFFLYLILNLSLFFIEALIFIFKVKLIYIFISTILIVFFLKKFFKTESIKKLIFYNKKNISNIITFGIASHFIWLLIYYLSIKTLIIDIHSKEFFTFFIINYLFDTIPFFGRILGLSELVGGLSTIYISINIGIIVKLILRLIIIAAITNLILVIYICGKKN